MTIFGTFLEKREKPQKGLKSDSRCLNVPVKLPKYLLFSMPPPPLGGGVRHTPKNTPPGSRRAGGSKSGRIDILHQSAKRRHNPMSMIIERTLIADERSSMIIVDATGLCIIGYMVGVSFASSRWRSLEKYFHHRKIILARQQNKFYIDDKIFCNVVDEGRRTMKTFRAIVFFHR